MNFFAGRNHSPPKVESKGAIPKQPKIEVKDEIIDSTNVAQLKSMKCKSYTPRVFRMKTYFDLIILLPECFAGDLASLINFVIDSNLRSDKIINHKKLIESVENILRCKFKTVKCHLIGSHAYNIAKGGLATVDIYLDLRECSLILFHFSLHIEFHL